MKIQENINLSQYTTFKIGGSARYFIEAQSVEEVIKAVEHARQNGLKFFILGGGSNVLFEDKGFDGVVILLRILECKIDDSKLVCGAGSAVEQALDLAIESGLSGLEWAGGLPGTVGGGCRGNAGAFGGEMKDSISNVVAVDELGDIKHYSNSECRFNYRDSIFKYNNEAILEVTFSLKPGDQKKLRAIADSHIEYRKQKHPLEFGNAGSIFKNTAVDKLSPELQKKWQDVIKKDPFPVVPTAKIIADAGLAGKTVGKAQVSTKHTNYIINLGGASAKDVKDLIVFVKKTVKEKFDIDLDVEVQIV